MSSVRSPKDDGFVWMFLRNPPITKMSGENADQLLAAHLLRSNYDDTSSVASSAKTAVNPHTISTTGSFGGMSVGSVTTQVPKKFGFGGFKTAPTQRETLARHQIASFDIQREMAEDAATKLPSILKQKHGSIIQPEPRRAAVKKRAPSTRKKQKVLRPVTFSSDEDFEDYNKSIVAKTASKVQPVVEVKPEVPVSRFNEALAGIKKGTSMLMVTGRPLRKLQRGDGNDMFEDQPNLLLTRRKPDAASTTHKYWNEVDSQKLRRLVNSNGHQYDRVNVWEVVVKEFPGRTAAECRAKYVTLVDQASGSPTATAKRNKAMNQSMTQDEEQENVQEENKLEEPVEFKPVAITAGKGTLARKRQLRSMIEERQQQYVGDDIFADQQDDAELFASPSHKVSSNCKEQFSPFHDDIPQHKTVQLRVEDPVDVDGYLRGIKQALKRKAQQPVDVISEAVRRQIAKAGGKRDRDVEKLVVDVLNKRKQVFKTSVDITDDEDEGEDGEEDERLQMYNEVEE